MPALGGVRRCCWFLLFILACATAAAVGAVSEVGGTASCDGHNTAPVDTQIFYTGPNQMVRKNKAGTTSTRCFNGQHWEDLYAFQHLLHGVGGGVFIELGALDGYSYSVTSYFEIYQHWTGLLIEASPQNHALFAQRSKRMRPRMRRNVPYVQAAVCGKPAELTYVSKEGTGAGILEFMAEAQQKRNRAHCKPASAEEVAAKGGVGKSECLLTPIRCQRLDTLLREKGLRHVDLFVLDVEGAELDVIQTLNFAETPVRYMLVELDKTAPEKDAGVRCVLRKAGMVPLGRLDLNELWHNPAFPHDEVAKRHAYSNVSSDRWKRCFVGSHVNFLKPLPIFGIPGSDQLHTEAQHVLTDEARSGADAETDTPRVNTPHHGGGGIATDDALPSAGPGFDEATLVLIGGCASIAGFVWYRRRLRR